MSFYDINWWESHFEWRHLKDVYTKEIHGRILNFGCGNGLSDVWLARSGYTVVGVDTDPVRIGFIQDFIKSEPKEVRDRLQFHLMDICSEDITKLGKFDSAWSSHVFEHITDHTCILENLAKVVEGNMLISVPKDLHFDCPEHVQHWKDADFLKTNLTERYGRIIKMIKTEDDFTEGYNVLRGLFNFHPLKEKSIKDTIITV